MWKQRFKIFMESNGSSGTTVLIKLSDDKFDSQREAFAWIDENANKERSYVILPVIEFYPNEAK